MPFAPTQRLLNPHLLIEAWREGKGVTRVERR